jgi:serine/threonine-protein kinase
MERLLGETLRRRLTEMGRTSASDAVTVMIQVLEGLSAAHGAGVLHRDIKPANIFITTPRGDSPVVKVIDFGLAKLIPTTAWKPRPEAPTEELSAITTTDVIPGTPFYLAPEQVAGSRDLDGRVDVWAAGLMFYEMLTGQRAYDAPSYAALVSSILLRPLPPLSSFRDDLPFGFDAVLAKAIAKRREDRFPTATAFRAALVAEWACFRAAGVVRGEQLRKYRPEAPTLPYVREEEVSHEDMTDVDVHVEFEPE